jgi:hypothetical protein
MFCSFFFYLLNLWNILFFSTCEISQVSIQIQIQMQMQEIWRRRIAPDDQKKGVQLPAYRGKTNTPQTHRWQRPPSWLGLHTKQNSKGTMHHNKAPPKHPIISFIVYLGKFYIPQPHDRPNSRRQQQEPSQGYLRHHPKYLLFLCNGNTVIGYES